jgi:hypothetical protein
MPVIGRRPQGGVEGLDLVPLDLGQSRVTEGLSQT